MKLLELFSVFEGKYKRSQMYYLFMPNGGEDGVLVGWRGDWPESHRVEFRGPPYTQWTGDQGSDFERLHDSLEGWHSTVLHTNRVLDIHPGHPDYENVRSAIEKGGNSISESRNAHEFWFEPGFPDDVRRAIESNMFDDPKVYCQHESYRWAVLLNKMGVPATIVEGEYLDGENYANMSHTWVKVGAYIFDPTPSQFDDWPNMDLTKYEEHEEWDDIADFGKLCAISEAIDPRQLVNVDTPQFRSWFGSSKAVDDEGHPIVFFRGTAKRPGPTKFGTKRTLPSFVASADIASVYSASYPQTAFGPAFGEEPSPPTFQPGATVSPVFLSIQNPVDMRGVELIDFEMGLFSMLNSDWSNYDEFAMMLSMLNNLRNRENNGQVFEYELPDLPGYISTSDWLEIMEWLDDAWEQADAEQWNGHAAEQITSVMAEIRVDAYAIVDTSSFAKWARSKGFDGVVHDDVFTQGAKFVPALLGKDTPNGLDEEDMHVTWRPFAATQVKSIFNQGGWSQETGSPMTDSIGESAFLHVHKDGRRVVNDKEEMGKDWETKKLREGNIMEAFAQADVDSISWFWAHPASGEIYHFDGSHTMAATDPNGPIALDVSDFGGYDNIDIDDNRVFQAAFGLGWVRSMFLPDEGHGSQVGLHGGTEGIVKQTYQMLVDKGLQVDSVGLRGEFDNFEFDGIPEDL